MRNSWKNVKYYQMRRPKSSQDSNQIHPKILKLYTGKGERKNQESGAFILLRRYLPESPESPDTPEPPNNPGTKAFIPAVVLFLQYNLFPHPYHE